MSGKVKVTQKKADAIENAINVLSDVGMPVGHLLDVLELGYEVVTEYKKGDWVKSTFGKGIGKIIGIDDLGYSTDSGMLADEYNIRHATPEEIAEEKERRFWAKHGRKGREFRPGDLFINTKRIDKHCFEVVDIRHDRSYPIRFIDKGGEENGYQFSAPLRIVCFAEDRLDVGGGH